MRKLGKRQLAFIKYVDTSPLVQGCYRGQSYWGSWSLSWDMCYRLRDLGYFEEVQFNDESRYLSDTGYQLTEVGRTFYEEQILESA